MPSPPWAAHRTGCACSGPTAHAATRQALDLSTRSGAAAETPVPPARTRPQGITGSAAPPAQPQRAQGSRRRRLWELPAEAHDVLLAMGLPPDTLRRLSEQALGRLHRARCRVGGSDTDLLYGVLHDLGHRNPLSDTLQRALDLRHAQPVRHLRSLREPAALQQAWARALQGPDMAAWLWALLTHPLGASLQEAALLDAQTWVFARARAQVAADAQAQADAHRHARLQADLQQAQLRCQLLQAEAAAERLQARAQEAALRGAVARLQQQLSQSTGAPLVAPQREPAARAEPRPAPQRTAQAAPAAPHHPAAPSAVRRGAALRTPVLRPGHRVLCVGGMPRAEAQYRALVERAGARFAYHDGGVEDGAQRLQQQLGAADLVVCQAGCLNHAAYRTIKGHCKRLDKPCLYLERPSLSRFARCLDMVRAAPLSDDVAGMPA